MAFERFDTHHQLDHTPTLRVGDRFSVAVSTVAVNGWFARPRAATRAEIEIEEEVSIFVCVGRFLDASCVAFEKYAEFLTL